MKNLLMALGMGAMLMGTSAMAIDDNGQSNNNPGALKAPDKTPDFPSCWTQSLTFYSAGDVFTFHVEKTEDTAAGILRVQTLDCCLVGDLWKSELLAEKPRFKTDTATGDGNTATFSGDAYVAPFNAGTVTVSYDGGTDVFPAGMTVEFCYSRERADGMDEISITSE